MSAGLDFACGLSCTGSDDVVALAAQIARRQDKAIVGSTGSAFLDI
jgi:hypothetical protein